MWLYFENYNAVARRCFFTTALEFCNRLKVRLTVWIPGWYAPTRIEIVHTEMRWIILNWLPSSASASAFLRGFSLAALTGRKPAGLGYCFIQTREQQCDWKTNIFNSRIDQTGRDWLDLYISLLTGALFLSGQYRCSLLFTCAYKQKVLAEVYGRYIDRETRLGISI